MEKIKRKEIKAAKEMKKIMADYFFNLDQNLIISMGGQELC